MTQVIIDDVIPRTQLVAAALQTVFNTNWTANATTDVLVYARADGVPPDDATQLVSSSLYNVTFIGASETVRVTFLTGRVLDDVITIVRNTPADRMNLYINTNFTPSMLNEDFGILTLVDQQAQMYDTVINPGYNISATISSKDLILPILGPDQVWRMNDAGTAIEAVTIDSSIPSPSDAYYWVSRSNAALDNEVNIGALTSGILKVDVSVGNAIPSIAQNAVDYWAPGDALIMTQIPTSPNDVTNKLYVDSVAIGFNIQPSCVCKSTVALTVTYDNGISGVGATLTNAGVQAALTLDGVSPSVSDRVLITNQASTLQNGIYTVTNVGSGATNWVLTRATDFDSPSEINPGDLVIVVNGTLYSSTSWLQVDTVTAVGTDPIQFIQFSASIPVSVPNGGTGLTSTTINEILYSSANNVIAGLPTQASSVLITSAGGVPSISNTLPATVQLNITQLGVITSSIVLATGTGLRTSVSAGNTALLQAYDVDAAAYTTFMTLTANNTPTCDLSTAVTIGGLKMGPITDWVLYTPTYTAFGTVSDSQIFSRRVGQSLQIRGRFTAGTSTGVEARMTLGFNGVDGGLTSTGATTITVAGSGTITFPFAGSFQPLIEPSTAYITFGILNAGTGGLTKGTGNGFTGAGTVVSIHCDIPITGW
jgi:hypothetical protein